MHKYVEQREGEQQDPGKVAEQMRPVLGQEKEACDRGKNDKGKRRSPTQTVRLPVRTVIHVSPPHRARAEL